MTELVTIAGRVLIVVAIAVLIPFVAGLTREAYRIYWSDE